MGDPDDLMVHTLRFSTNKKGACLVLLLCKMPEDEKWELSARLTPGYGKKERRMSIPVEPDEPIGAVMEEMEILSKNFSDLYGVELDACIFVGGTKKDALEKMGELLRKAHGVELM